MFWSRSLDARVSKRVAFFLLAYRAGSLAHHDGEVEGVRLVPVERAPAVLTYPGERRVDGGRPRLARDGRLRWARREERPRAPRADRPCPPPTGGSPCTR